MALRDDHALDAQHDAGGAPSGLRPDRLGQGAPGTGGGDAARVEEFADPGGHAFSWAIGRAAAAQPLCGLQLPVLIGGAVVVEYIFGLPGIGRLVVDSIKIRDYPIITGVNVYAAIFVLVINIIIDLSYAWLDPRIRFK